MYGRVQIARRNSAPSATIRAYEILAGVYARAIVRD